MSCSCQRSSIASKTWTHYPSHPPPLGENLAWRSIRCPLLWAGEPHDKALEVRIIRVLYEYHSVSNSTESGGSAMWSRRHCYRANGSRWAAASKVAIVDRRDCKLWIKYRLGVEMGGR